MRLRWSRAAALLPCTMLALFCFFQSVPALPAGNRTAPPVPQNAVYTDLFPDANLAALVATAAGTTPDQVVTQPALDGITSLFGAGEDIGDLTGISYLQNLTGLNMSGNPGILVPAEIGGLPVLRELNLSSNPGIVIPAEIGRLAALEQLNLSYNPGMVVPAEINNLSALTTLFLNNSGLTALPEIGRLVRLQKLYLTDNSLRSLPASIGNLTAMTELYVGNNRLDDVPNSLTNLTSLVTLNLGTNNLTHIPVPMLNLVNLDTLYIDNNRLSGPVPDSISRLTKLKLLYIYSNQITSLPDSMGTMTSLEQFAADDNEITYVPQSLENLPNLVQLHLDHNRVTSTLPAMAANVAYRNNNMAATLPLYRLQAGGPLAYGDLVPDAMKWARGQNSGTFAGLGAWTLTLPDGSTRAIAAGDGSEISGALFTAPGSYSLVFTFGDISVGLLAHSVYTMPVQVERPTLAAQNASLPVGTTKPIPGLQYTPATATLHSAVQNTAIATISGATVAGHRQGTTAATLWVTDAYGNQSDPVTIQITVTADDSSSSGSSSSSSGSSSPSSGSASSSSGSSASSSGGSSASGGAPSSAPSSSGGALSPATGDGGGLYGYIVLASVSTGAICMLGYLRLGRSPGGRKRRAVHTRGQHGR